MTTTSSRGASALTIGSRRSVASCSSSPACCPGGRTRFGARLRDDNAFDYPVNGVVPYVIFVAIALVTIITQTESLRLPAVLSHPLLLLGGAVIGTALVGYRFFSDRYGGGSRGLGLYLAVAAALLVLAGCILTYRESDRPR